MQDNGVAPGPLPEPCLFALGDLIGRVGVAALVARLDDAAAGGAPA